MKCLFCDKDIDTEDDLAGWSFDEDSYYAFLLGDREPNSWHLECYEMTMDIE